MLDDVNVPALRKCVSSLEYCPFLNSTSSIMDDDKQVPGDTNYVGTVSVCMGHMIAEF